MPAPVELSTPPETGSLSDHEAQFHSRSGASAVAETTEAPPVSREPVSREPSEPGPDTNEDAREAQLEAEEQARDPQGRFKDRERHRSTKQRATAADAPRISELTKKWRTTESERDAIKAERDRLAAELEQARRGIVAEKSGRPAEKSDLSAEKFDKPKPTVESLGLAGSADPYGDLPEALDDWREEKKAFESAQRERATSAQRAAQQKEAGIIQAHIGRVTEFAAKHPDYQSVIDAYPHKNISPVMQYAMLTSDKSAELMYALAKQPVFLDELFLLTEGRTIEQAEASGLVASLQRRMLERAQAASTGTVAPLVKKPSAPRPPIPVRTGPLTTGTEPPGDGASLAEHESFYGRARRR